MSRESLSFFGYAVWRPRASMALLLILAVLLGSAAATGRTSVFALAALPLLAAAALLFFFLLRPAPVVWLFVIGLPLHTFVLMVLFGGLGLPRPIISVLSVWKELLALGAATVFATRVLPQTLLRGRVRLTGTDRWMVAFTAWIGLRLVLSHALGSGVPLGIEVYGLRFYLLPVGLYVIGRTAPLEPKTVARVLVALAVIGGLTGMIAIVEQLIPDGAFVALLRRLGYHAYFLEYVRADGFYGPESTAASMWIPIGGRFVRRAGSIYMISKPFAFTYFLILPIVTALLWKARTRWAYRWFALMLMLCWAGLLLSITRAVIAVGFIVTVLMYVTTRRWTTIALVVYGALLVAAIGLLIPSIQDYAVRTLTGNDSSTSQHLTGWAAGVSVSGENLVLGTGVGTANQELHRFRSMLNFDPPPISESVYVQTLQELGIAGLLLYLGSQFSLLRRASRIRRHANQAQAQLGFSMQWATIGILLASFVAIPWQGSFVLTYFFWLLAGQLQRTSASALAQDTV